ncbi:MAG: hypothetical protein H6907_12795 [Hyphomicrobiales bacterium]|nr:hypothetical protein [Hyphomicrobiales bacterium]MCP5372601.1 hypothetical protein [Hyphomicrobiales bacterium]
MDPAARRAALVTRPNPDRRHDYLVTLRGSLGTGAGLRLRYVPDKLVIEAPSLNAYLLRLADMDWKGLEHLAVCVLEDVNNETVARWIQVEVTMGDGLAGHSVLLEDRQPKWDNPALLARLGPG